MGVFSSGHEWQPAALTLQILVLAFRRESLREMGTIVLFRVVGTAFLLWVAENVGTAAGAWIYPHQQAGWEMVVLVTLVHPPQTPVTAAHEPRSMPTGIEPPPTPEATGRLTPADSPVGAVPR